MTGQCRVPIGRQVIHEGYTQIIRSATVRIIPRTEARRHQLQP